MHDRRRETLEYPCLEAARAVRKPIAGAVQDQAKIVGFNVRPVRQRRFVDIEHEGGPAHRAGTALDVGAGGRENRRDIAVVVAGLIGQQHLLDLVDIERRRRRLGNVHLRLGRAIPRAGNIGRAAQKGCEHGSKLVRERRASPRLFPPSG